MISDEEKSINNAFQQIGKIYYETFGGNPEQCFAQLITNVKESEEKISGYADQISQLKGVINCQTCNGEIPEGASFCSSCGSAVVLPVTEEAPTDNSSCGQCGYIITPDLLFCTSCGNKLNSPVEHANVESDHTEPVHAEIIHSTEDTQT